jgi:hypothetical protein
LAGGLACKRPQIHYASIKEEHCDVYLRQLITNPLLVVLDLCELGKVEHDVLCFYLWTLLAYLALLFVATNYADVESLMSQLVADL